MSRLTLLPLRALLALLFAGSLAAQIASASLASGALEGAAAGILAGLIVAGGLAVEAVLLGAWMLVGLIPGEAIFTEQSRADAWVRVALVALRVGALLGASGFVFFAISQAVEPTSSGPTLLVLSAAATGIGAALALLVGVMRRLLRTAIRLQSELSEVI